MLDRCEVWRYGVAMVMQFLGDDGSRPYRESADSRAERLRRGSEIIGEGEAELAAGLGIDEASMDEWFEALEADPDAPLPSRGPAIAP